MHVHVGVEDPELRIDLMNQLKYFLPHILAFSTSSPFWDSQKTGLMCYRLSVFDRLPRTGLGEYFESFAQYERYVEVMVNAGLVSDTSALSGIYVLMRASQRSKCVSQMSVPTSTTQSRLRRYMCAHPSTHPFENRESALESLRAESDQGESLASTTLWTG